MKFPAVSSARCNAEHTTTRRSLLAGSALLLLPPLAGRALAQSPAVPGWPTRPVRLITASVAGGTIDTSVRMLTNRLADRFGQPFLVDNRGGAGGTIAAEAVARSAPDGYTLLAGSIADQVINVFIRRNSNQSLPYDAEKDFVPVAIIEQGGNVLVAHPSLPANTLPELVQLAKSQPGRLAFASGGVGQTSHLSGELFKKAAGIDLLHVPYRGNAPAVSDVLAGTVKLLFESTVTAEPNIRAGKLKPLAVTTRARLPALPDVPTFAELGLRDVVITPYILLLAPAGTPAPVVQALNRATVEIMNSPAARNATRAALGWETPNMTPEQLAEFLLEDRRRWEPIIMGSNIKVN